MTRDIIPLSIPAAAGRPELTDRQEHVLAVIRAWREVKGYPPTVRDIMRAMGWRSPNAVTDHLIPLRHKGYLSYADGARSLVVLEATP